MLFVQEFYNGMKKIQLQTTIEEWEDESQLPNVDKSLLKKALEGLKNTYAPYSGFHVSAAVLLDDGTIVIGTNQENAAYPSGLCAERVAFFAASSQYPRKEIKAAAVVANSDLFSVDHPIAPCGACRQVMLEYELKQKTPIRLILRGGKRKLYTLSDIKGLLPLFFHESGLKKP